MKFTCEICNEPKLFSYKFKNNVCVHPFCWECISRYIESKVVDNATNIQCPALECDKSLDPITARAILTPKIFNRWCDNLCESAVLGLKTCYCPFKDCSTLVVDECGGGRTSRKETTCPNCKRLFCFSCRFRWHPGYRCAEIRNLRDENDKKFLDLIQEKSWTSCPKCHHPVDRIGGCISIHCRCGITFCHLCGKTGICKCMFYARRDNFLVWVLVLFLCLVIIIVIVLTGREIVNAIKDKKLNIHNISPT